MTGPTSIPVFAERPDWYDRARCAELDMPVKERLALFFPPPGQAGHRAVSICRECPVEDVCRSESMGERFGVWGGLYERGRQRARRTPARDMVAGQVELFGGSTDGC